MDESEIKRVCQAFTEEITKRLQENLVKARKDYIRDFNFKGKFSEMWQGVYENEISSYFFHPLVNLDVLEQRGISCFPYVFWSEKLIRAFLKKGLKVDSKDELGRTALYLAVEYGLFDVAKLLLSSGADPNSRDMFGNTPLLNLLPRWREVENCYGELLTLLLKHGADVSASKENGETVLHLLCHENSRYVLDLLRTFTGNVNGQTCKQLYQKSKLMIVVKFGLFAAFQLFIEKGADVTVTDLQGWTPLHHAIYFSNKKRCCGKIDDETMLKVIDNPCGKNVCYSLLSEESRMSDPDYAIQLILSNAGADPVTVRSVSGRNAYDLACLIEKPLLPIDVAKRIPIYELFGAFQILNDLGFVTNGVEMWVKAYSMCKRNSLEVSSQLLANYTLIKKWHENHDPNQKVPIGKELVFPAIQTIHRISHGISKLWNLLYVAVRSRRKGMFDKILKCVSRKSPVGSIEEIDLCTMESLVNEVLGKTHVLHFFSGPSVEKEMDLSIKVWIANLSIKCTEMFVAKTESNVILNDSLQSSSYTVSQFLAKMIINPPEAASAKTANEIKELLTHLIALNPRDKDGDTFLHRICHDFDSAFSRSFRLKFLDLLIKHGADVTSENLFGFSPIQMINVEYVKNAPQLAIELAVNGAVHVDARNSFSYQTSDVLQENDRFRFSNLKCLCARVLARSVVIYKDVTLLSRRKVPKKIVNFINEHVFFDNIYDSSDDECSINDSVDDDDDSDDNTDDAGNMMRKALKKMMTKFSQRCFDPDVSSLG